MNSSAGLGHLLCGAVDITKQKGEKGSKLTED